MSWMLHNGKVLTVDGKIAISPECCCDTGCCPNNLHSDDILIAEIIGLSGPHVECWSLGDKTELHFNAAIWQSIDCFDHSYGLEMACVDNDHFGVAWLTANPNGCNPIPSTPSNWYQISGSCDPFEFVFAVDLVDDASITCDQGTITIRITKKP